MDFSIQFDPFKARLNASKHGVQLADAAAVLDDPRALTVEEFRYDETRWITLGQDGAGRLLVVVYTYRDPDYVRLISARKAEPREIQQYYGG
jgi:uncharacterized DUF497 family protein